MVDLTTLIPLVGAPRLVPATLADLEVLEGIKRDARLNTKITLPRSSPHSRWFHKLVDVVAEAIGRPPAWLKFELKLRAALFDDVHRSPRFGTVPIVKSTAFDKMDETEFTAFRRVAVELLFTEPDFLQGTHRKDVYKHVSELLGERCPWQD